MRSRMARMIRERYSAVVVVVVTVGDSGNKTAGGGSSSSNGNNSRVVVAVYPRGRRTKVSNGKRAQHPGLFRVLSLYRLSRPLPEAHAKYERAFASPARRDRRRRGRGVAWRASSGRNSASGRKKKKKKKQV